MSLLWCVLLAAALAAAATARGAVAVHRATRRPDPADDPATALAHPLAQVHYELLAARTALRLALGAPLVGPGELRRPEDRGTGGGGTADAGDGTAQAGDGTAVAGDGPAVAGDGDGGGDGSAGEGTDGGAAVAEARARLARLWRAHAEVLGGPQDPRWHLRGGIDWVHLGPVGRQVVTLRLTLGHEPGRWLVVRAHRRTGRASFGLWGGRAPLTGVLRAPAAEGALAALLASVADPTRLPGPSPAAPGRRWVVPGPGLVPRRQRWTAPGPGPAPRRRRWAPSWGRWQLAHVEVVDRTGHPARSPRPALGPPARAIGDAIGGTARPGRRGPPDPLS
jgi:hypothetical protein